MDSTQEEKEKQARKVLRFVLITSKYARSGKDLMADLLFNEYKKHRKSNILMRFRFASALVETFEDLFNYQWDIDKLNPEVRTKLIKFSETCKTIDKYIWINKTVKEVDRKILNQISNSAGKNIICFFTDCRYQYEYEYLQRLLQKIGITYHLLVDMQLIEVIANGVAQTTDRDNPEDSISKKADITIYNAKESIADYEKEILDKLGFIFK